MPIVNVKCHSEIYQFFKNWIITQNKAKEHGR